LDLYRQAVTIADALEAAPLIRLAYADLAEGCLFVSDLDAARRAITVSRQHDRPERQNKGTALQGIILARLAQHDAARTAFLEALAYADEELADTAELYGPKYARGRALAGLALLGDDPAARWVRAAEAYRAGRANCDAAGVLAVERRRLEYLAPLDGEGHLEALRVILR
jgi:hypothetical protein